MAVTLDRTGLLGGKTCRALTPCARRSTRSSLAQRRKVPAGHGRGRQIVFAVDSSSFRLVSPARVKRASLLSTTSADLSPSSRVLRSEQAVRFGLDNVARGNDAVAFACVYKKANLQPPDVGPFVDGVPVSTERDEQLRKEAERKDKARCEARVRSIRGGRQSRRRRHRFRGDHELRRERGRRIRRGRPGAVRRVHARGPAGRRKRAARAQVPSGRFCG